jgi:hypothetical protein
MGLPVVGKRHRRNAYTQKAANRDLGTVPDRICSAGGIGHSSTHNQRSIAAARSASKRQRPLGALLLRRIAAERNHDAGHVHGVRQDVDSSALGQHAPGASQDRGSRTMAADGRQSERNQGQNQNRISEVLGLRWSDVDWLGSTLSIKRGIVEQHVDECKTEGSAKALVLAEGLLARLKAWKQASQFRDAEDWVFASPYSIGRLPYSYGGTRDELSRAAKASGIGPVSLVGCHGGSNLRATENDEARKHQNNHGHLRGRCNR